MSDVNAEVDQLGRQAKAASKLMAIASSEAKNRALHNIADALQDRAQTLLQSNQRDMQNAEEKGLDPAMLDRLALDEKRIAALGNGLRQIAQLADPVAALSAQQRQANGLKIAKMRVPIGVIGIIYESRPNVTADAGALCLKSGNACILRGGSESFYSSTAIVELMREGIATAGLPADAVQAIATSDRAAVGALLQAKNWVDVIIPRGSKRLIQRVDAESTIPVIKHLEGLCHVYIDASASAKMAIDIAFNAKTYRYGICGAMESLLIHRSQLDAVLPELITKLQERGVEVRGDQTVCAMAKGVSAATEADWSTEYLAPILSIKAVDSIDAAIAHIGQYGSGHTDSIVTSDLQAADQFVLEVDSASVMVNAPTNFADGFEYGLGAEIGISTNRLHVRGPVGLEGLTTEKYVVRGNGQLRH